MSILLSSSSTSSSLPISLSVRQQRKLHQYAVMRTGYCTNLNCMGYPPLPLVQWSIDKFQPKLTNIEFGGREEAVKLLTSFIKFPKTKHPAPGMDSFYSQFTSWTPVDHTTIIHECVGHIYYAMCQILCFIASYYLDTNIIWNALFL